ncbi:MULTISPECIES: 2-amino-4-hydroxy-6-hydroxymethyldihydropteridine diphosphokinase [Prochlorococcus]|uniref:2-amino-4-hydroxy-6-hydroxymethyldihydropteridine diphosphokinase n=1 Tax=Prochlorococcus marinus (strain SARG / CCMP1375 / SS120) TaxID=167539 RepID=Q7VDQ0_PROMA|nr:MULTISPECIES: 2-amino-4-hydroxy-6-hydroxymethyldihydropteridine diphosphokinase [Prochlorococcus]AAP99364.1 7,8-dihydro-6-hydroxymethylpterin-pyrophosphokinase [Prochlorococcus marinus subsp. marinus str. CCMP1375]KGG11365.1 2-amino-4-hydroxy-6- hydroxymethyldihydropteridine pyrophosphokinase [Prochlorococcus marinus str. LG]KGG18680.1 2-amino-4-hydroxy-6- hydroxymethyldihydropteridine pyrophosphokinase [Prochlorococcus marinus str. SS2]KGG22953.1 2-amino-4-hydroxy-6- hydroxymethyldihydropte
MSSINYLISKTLAIGLGANIESPAGSPAKTLITARPLLENTITSWIKKSLKNASKNSIEDSTIDFSWSPLYRTAPLGGPKTQPSFINAALVIREGGLNQLIPSVEAARDLLNNLLLLEKHFGRDREISKIHWGPRSLDLDILAWGDLQINDSDLILPHPYLIERDFVIIPLAQALVKKSSSPIQIPSQKGWPE